MLEPNDPKKRDLIYHYLLLLDILETPARAKAFFEKKKNKKAVRMFRKAIRSETLKRDIRNRKKKAKRVGEIIRFWMHEALGIKDPSINKATICQRQGLSIREKGVAGWEKFTGIQQHSLQERDAAF